METFYINYNLMLEKRKIAEENAEMYIMYKQARAGLGSRWSRLLVKLSRMLIKAGLHLKAYAENEPAMNSQFVASLQE
jgi:hypothetical protein